MIAGAQITLDPAAPAAAQTDQPFPVRGQFFPAEAARGQRLALRVSLDQRGEPAQRAIAGGAGGQQDELAGSGACFFRVGRRDLRLPHRQRHADHRLDLGGAAGAGEGHGAVERIGVGERQMGQSILAGAGGQLRDRRRRAEQGEVGMDFQVGEGHNDQGFGLQAV